MNFKKAIEEAKSKIVEDKNNPKIISLDKGVKPKRRWKIFSFLQHPMLKMISWKVKLVIVLVASLLVIGIITAGQWIAMGIDKLPIDAVTGSNIFYGIGWLVLAFSIYHLVTIKSATVFDKDKSEELSGMLNDMRNKNLDSDKVFKNLNSEINRIKKSKSEKFFWIVSSLTLIWDIAGLWTPYMKIFIAKIVLPYAGPIALFAFGKKASEFKFIAIINPVIDLVIVSYILIDFYFIK